MHVAFPGGAAQSELTGAMKPSEDAFALRTCPTGLAETFRSIFLCRYAPTADLATMCHEPSLHVFVQVVGRSPGPPDRNAATAHFRIAVTTG